MKPLGEVIRRCGLRNHQYADDTQLYLSFSTNPGEAVAVLNQCLAEVMGWMRANKLKLNPDKTEVLLVGGSSFGEGELNQVLNGVALPLRDKVHSLGVLLDPELSLEAQVTAVARSAFFQLRLIHQLRPYLEYDCLATVTHALVTSRLDFCNALYVGLPLKMVRILQLVQNRAARLLTGTGRYVHMTPVLRQLHWLPIEVRAQFKVLVITYKALNGLGPGYLKECLRPYMPTRPLRSAGEALLREPSVKEIRRIGTRRRAFSAVAPNLWNALPREADINAPDLKTTYKNVLQLIKVTFSSIDIHLHTEALLNTMNFLNNLLPTQESTAVEITQEKEEKREVLKKFTSKKSKYEDVCDLHVCADMSCLRVFLRDQKRRISEIRVEGLDSQVMMKKETTEISAKLKNIIIVDCDEAALYKKALYITGKEVFSFKMVTYMYATDGISYTNMNAVDSKIYLTVGCIQIVFVNKFVSAILAFVNNFQTAKEAITEATVQAAEKAASGVKELAQQSSRMALDVNIKAPVVIIPQSAISTDVLVADFGLITIKNEFLLVKTKLRSNIPPILDSIHVTLSELKLYRSSSVSGLLQNEIQLLQPLNLEVTVERNLAALWYHEIPDIKISGRLKPMNYA
ncbi:Vacuolar protein sorting-associated protein 13A [Varanus komodoensis]|nr:Vacuolar protein sorting-associated protein 13A [Varanus komodoensis]